MSENNGSQSLGEEASPAAEATLHADSVRDVFVSYASQDSELANTVVLALEKNGLTCWIAPRDVVPGDLYADGIIRAITGSKVFVLVLSRDAIASNHVGKEVERASSKRRPIVAIRTDMTPLTPALEYFLSESQWIELHAGQPDPALTKVVDAVRRQCGAEATKPSVNLEPNRRTQERFWMPLVVVVGLLIVVVAYFLVDKFRGSVRGKEDKPVVASVPAVQNLAPAAQIISQKSVAVLPFLDMSEKKDQEYFSDGLAEELIDLLARISELRVPARTSSFYFKGKSEDIPSIAKRLAVAHILEGSVRKSGNHLRVTVQLVRADTGYHIWSQTYERDVEDVFKIQDNIANAVVSALKISLLGSNVPIATQTSDTEAYLLYLKGMTLFHRSTLADDAGAEVALKEAVARDPNYAPAWVMLARVLRVRYLDGAGSYAELSAAVRQAAERAVKLEPKLPDAYVALAASHLLDWQWGAADSAIKQALALEPDNPRALMYASFLALDRGQTDLAVRYGENALVRDPLDPFIYLTLEQVYNAADRHDIAEARWRRSFELNPLQEGVHSSLAWYLYFKGDIVGATAENEKETDEASRLYLRIFILEKLGRRAETDADFALYVKNYGAGQPFTIASIYGRRGDIELAFDWLERAYEQHDDSLAGLKHSLGFENLHADLRYKAMLRKMNLPE